MAASTTSSAAAASSGGAIPNVKELTSRQRNWFPNFEKSSSNTNDAASAKVTTETPTSVESSRRESVKNDSVPQTVSNLGRNSVLS